jgi:hypothetical protein
LPSISKVIESIVFEHLDKYFTENKILSKKQFGFRKKHATIEALLAIQRCILSVAEIKKKICTISLDLYKAFDTVDHNLLILKLLMIGFDLPAIKWFKSYLSERYQAVIHNGLISQ